jgi:hypothetical protein
LTARLEAEAALQQLAVRGLLVQIKPLTLVVLAAMGQPLQFQVHQLLMRAAAAGLAPMEHLALEDLAAAETVGLDLLPVQPEPLIQAAVVGRAIIRLRMQAVLVLSFYLILLLTAIYLL